MFILELTLRAWQHAEENKRRTLQRNDVAAAITRTDIFDFLEVLTIEDHRWLSRCWAVLVKVDLVRLPLLCVSGTGGAGSSVHPYAPCHVALQANNVLPAELRSPWFSQPLACTASQAAALAPVLTSSPSCDAPLHCLVQLLMEVLGCFVDPTLALGLLISGAATGKEEEEEGTRGAAAAAAAGPASSGVSSPGGGVSALHQPQQQQQQMGGVGGGGGLPSTLSQPLHIMACHAPWEPQVVRLLRCAAALLCPHSVFVGGQAALQPQSLGAAAAKKLTEHLHKLLGHSSVLLASAQQSSLAAGRSAETIQDISVPATATVWAAAPFTMLPGAKGASAAEQSWPTSQFSLCLQQRSLDDHTSAFGVFE
ncbi:histone-fold [Haematococcus lacustris]|uniref:Histone-fold n=1 Tax=Haematococcus lacustris TaxID=44745 RepID=A0A699YVM7_HAELA|nr:histone-fold [Haematococcus lacustris]